MIFFFSSSFSSIRAAPADRVLGFWHAARVPGECWKAEWAARVKRLVSVKFAQDLIALENTRPIPFLQPDNPGQLRERAEILVAFSIFKVSSGQTQKCLSMLPRPYHCLFLRL